MSEQEHNTGLTPEQQINHLEAQIAERDQKIAEATMTIENLQYAIEIANAALADSKKVVGSFMPTKSHDTEQVAAPEEATEPHVTIFSPRVAKNASSATRTARSPETRRSKVIDTCKRNLGKIALVSVFGLGGLGIGSLLENDHESVANIKPVAAHTANKPSTGTAAVSPNKANTHSVHQRELTKAAHDTTVAEAVTDLHGNQQDLKQNIQAIFNQPAHRLDHTSTHDAMSSLLSKFNTVDSVQAAEGVAYSVKGSPAYAALAYNNLFGTPNAKTLPKGITNAQAVKAVEGAMLADTTTMAMKQPSGTFINHGQHGETVYDAGVITLTGNKDVFIMTLTDGRELIVKDFAGHLCENILNRYTQTSTTPSPAPRLARMTTPVPTPGPKQPGIVTPQPKVPTNETPTPSPKVPSHSTPTPKPKHIPIPPKTDPNTTPAGVPGEGHGTGIVSPTTSAGKGPAGQPVNPNTGFLSNGNEAQPPRQPQQPEPAPLTGGSSTSVTSGNETTSTGNTTTIPAGSGETGSVTNPVQGQDNGPSQPVTNSTSAGNQISGTPTTPN